MRTSESIQKIAEALSKMQPELGVISKSGENKFDKYTYATLEDYIKGTREVLSAHGFFLVTSAEKLEQLPDRITKNGGSEHAIQINLTLRLIHSSGEWIEVNCLGEGQDRADKAVYKAITGARKYAIASLLGLATSDDPEADEDVGHAPAPKQAARQNVQNLKPNPVEVDKILTDWVASFDEETDGLKLKDKFAKAYTYTKKYGTHEQLDMITAAYNSKKTELALYAQNGVRPQ